MSKYKSKKAEFLGRKYHSQLEAKRAAQLELLKQAGEIIDWEPQYNIPLYASQATSELGKCKRVKVCNYIIDFKVLNKNGNLHFEEIKGVWTPVGKLKLKWLKIQHPTWDIRVLTKKEID